MNQEDLVEQDKVRLHRLPRWQKLPEGAILLSDGEVLSKQYKKISEWKPTSQMWPFTYGSGLLGSFAGISGFVITKHYRKILQLGAYARVVTYLPTVIVPALTSMLFHSLIVSNDILLGKLNCPICLGTRSGLLQVSLGAVYPLLIGPISCIIQAKKFYTYAVPAINHHREMFKMLRTTAPITNALMLMVVSNFALGMFIATKEGDTFLNVLMKDQWNKELDKDGFD